MIARLGATGTLARVVAPVIGLLLVVTALAGCTGDDATPKPTGSTTSSAAPADPGVTDITEAPGSGEGLVGAVADNADLSCQQDGDSWVVGGTLTNPTDAPADYRVYISLLNAANDTRGLQQVNVDAVEPATPTEWTMTVPVADDDLTCVPRIERYVTE